MLIIQVINSPSTEHHVQDYHTVHHLDLYHLEDAGDLDTVVKKPVSFGNNNITKDKPDLSVFAKPRRNKSKKNIVEFISPYERFVMMKPYLESLQQPAEGEQSSEANKSSNDNIRLDSITKHFEKLNEMTPKSVKKKEEAEEEKEGETGEVSTDTEDEVVEPKNKKPYFEERPQQDDKVKNFRPYKKNVQKQKRKNESQTNEGKKKEVFKKKEADDAQRNNAVSEETKEFDYNNVNFKNFGSKKREDKDFNPNKSEKENSKKGGKKKQQFHNRGNRSHTFSHKQ